MSPVALWFGMLMPDIDELLLPWPDIAVSGIELPYKIGNFERVGTRNVAPDQVRPGIGAGPITFG